MRTEGRYLKALIEMKARVYNNITSGISYSYIYCIPDALVRWNQNDSGSSGIGYLGCMTPKSRKSHNEHIRELGYEKLMGAKDLKCEIKAAVVSGKCCAFCNALNGQAIPLDDMIEFQPVGSDQCTNPKGCNCTYLFDVVKDDVIDVYDHEAG